jgi:hypothetical protein
MSELAKAHKTVTSLLKLEDHDEIKQAALQLSPTDHLDLLRKWQSNRLEHTYADLLVTKRYGPACRFFLDDVYSAKDFRQRDHEIKHLYAMLSHYLPDALLKLVKKVIELNDLTNQLDEALLDALRHDLGVNDAVTAELYAEGYRICNNYAERESQIELIVEVGRMVDIAAKIPFVATMLKMARIPVSRAGWHELHSWIERGFLAFQHMHGADEFLGTIHDREMKILGRIFAGDPEPFKPYL